MSATDSQIEDHATLAELYQRHGDWLRGAMRKRGAGDGIEDVVQETFERLVGLGDPPALDRPKAFLLKVAQNLLRDRVRRETAQKRTAPENIFVQPHLAGSTEQFETVLLKQVILALPAGQREVFMLSRFGGLPYEEIARICGVSVKTVEWRMAKATAACASKLRE